MTSSFNSANFSINLDNNASYPLHPEVRAALTICPFDFLNPSSIHQAGQKARFVVENARDAIKKAINASSSAVAFTSGATESNNSCLMSPFWSYLNTRRSGGVIPELIISSVEHPAVYEVAKRLEQLGVVLTIIPPRKDGRFYPEDFADKVTERTKLVSVMMVNNETGIVLPVKEIFSQVKNKNSKTLCHTDAVQAFGKTSINFADIAADYMSLSAHKIGGLTGVGAIVMPDGVSIDPALVGGPQETRRRPGTENVVGIFSFGIAAEAMIKESNNRFELLKRNGALLRDELKAQIPSCSINFQEAPTVGNTVSVTFNNSSSNDLVVAFDLSGVLTSGGSACSSGKLSASSVLLSHGFCESDARRTIRLSVNHYQSEQEIKEAVSRIALCYSYISGSIAA